MTNLSRVEFIALDDRFDHQRTVILSRGRFEWMHLRLQNLKNVSEYNSEMCRIVSTLRLCGQTVKEEDMLEKTFSTFHASNLYRERGFMTYSELHTCLIFAEENNQLLLHNHQNRPAGSVPIPDQSQAVLEANVSPTREDVGEARVVVAIMDVVQREKEKGATIHRSTQISKRTMETSPKNLA
ncbi:hypothetical protein V2J09_017171 [Rumex salicifolius]